MHHGWIRVLLARQCSSANSSRFRFSSQRGLGAAQSHALSDFSSKVVMHWARVFFTFLWIGCHVQFLLLFAEHDKGPTWGTVNLGRKFTLAICIALEADLWGAFFRSDTKPKPMLTYDSHFNLGVALRADSA